MALFLLALGVQEGGEGGFLGGDVCLPTGAGSREDDSVHLYTNVAMGGHGPDG